MKSSDDLGALTENLESLANEVERVLAYIDRLERENEDLRTALKRLGVQFVVGKDRTTAPEKISQAEGVGPRTKLKRYLEDR